MKKYKQLVCDNEIGDCFRACVATILQIPIEKLPNPLDPSCKVTWYDIMREIGFDLHYTKACWVDGFWIASVPSKNFEGCTHAIVMKGYNVFFDPSTKKRYRTNRCMLGTGLIEYGYIITLDDVTKLPNKEKIYAT